MTAGIDSTAPTFAWDDLSERLERFIETWNGGTEPPLVEFLPGEPPVHRRLVLVELIKVDLEQRTTRGQPNRSSIMWPSFRSCSKTASRPAT